MLQVMDHSHMYLMADSSLSSMLHSMKEIKESGRYRCIACSKTKLLFQKIAWLLVAWHSFGMQYTCKIIS